MIRHRAESSVTEGQGEGKNGIVTNIHIMAVQMEFLHAAEVNCTCIWELNAV